MDGLREEISLREEEVEGLVRALEEEKKEKEQLR